LRVCQQMYSLSLRDAKHEIGSFRRGIYGGEP